MLSILLMLMPGADLPAPKFAPEVVQPVFAAAPKCVCGPACEKGECDACACPRKMTYAELFDHCRTKTGTLYVNVFPDKPAGAYCYLAGNTPAYSQQDAARIPDGVWKVGPGNLFEKLTAADLKPPEEPARPKAQPGTESPSIPTTNVQSVVVPSSSSTGFYRPANTFTRVPRAMRGVIDAGCATGT